MVAIDCSVDATVMVRLMACLGLPCFELLWNEGNLGVVIECGVFLARDDGGTLVCKKRVTGLFIAKSHCRQTTPRCALLPRAVVCRLPFPSHLSLFSPTNSALEREGNLEGIAAT